jgi:hypothetical protein
VLPAQQEHHHWQYSNLFFDPSTSENSNSLEDSNYAPPTPLRKIITTSDDSWPDNSNSQTSDQTSTSNQAGNQNHPASNSDPEISSDSEIEIAFPEEECQEVLATLVTSPRGRPPGSRNQPDSWKKIVVEADPEAIATRTRNKQVQNVPADHGNPPHDLNIGAVCCNQCEQECVESSSNLQESWKLRYRYALSPCNNSSEHV